MMLIKICRGFIIFMMASNAYAGVIGFNAEFVVTGVEGTFAPGLIGNVYEATVTVDDTCGSNYDFGCSYHNAAIEFVFEGVDIGDPSRWDNVLYSAMADYSVGGPAPFAYIDPVYDDVFFGFYKTGWENRFNRFHAGRWHADDANWEYRLPDLSRVYGTFEITSRQVPEPHTLALMGLGLAGLGFGRRKVKAKLKG